MVRRVEVSFLEVSTSLSDLTRMGAFDLASQAHNSFTFTLVSVTMMLIFGGWLWVPLALLVGLALGCAERRLINRRCEQVLF